MEIAIFGGTFDPPHLGHLIMAEEVVNACRLDEVWFMPSPDPPHKTDEVIAESGHRIEMVRTAIAGNNRFRLSLIEFERNGTSYSYDTVKQLLSQYPEHRFRFLIGADMVEYLPNWHKVDDLIRLIPFIGVGRPGFSLKSPYRDFIEEVEVPKIEISSSMIRKRLKEKKGVRYFIPENVQNYIVKKGLYEQGNGA